MGSVPRPTNLVGFSDTTCQKGQNLTGVTVMTDLSEMIIQITSEIEGVLRFGPITRRISAKIGGNFTEKFLKNFQRNT
jgi:hypothetical protein